jgi:hypothetical protein
VDALVAILKAKNWVRNPWFIPDSDYHHLLSCGVIALQAMVPLEERRLIAGLVEESFWQRILPLMRGDTHTMKQRVRQQLERITGNAAGNVQSQHAKLRVVHDLPLYVEYMIAQYDKLNSLKSNDRAEQAVANRGAMDQEDLMDHLVMHASKFILQLRTEYASRKNHAVLPYTIDTLMDTIADMSRNHVINPAKVSTFDSEHPMLVMGAELRMNRVQPEVRAVHDPSSHLEERVPGRPGLACLGRGGGHKGVSPQFLRPLGAPSAPRPC